ncbi:MttA family protein [Slackia sp. CM382]|nr:MttA family protein [Slackia sp. CM382]
MPELLIILAVALLIFGPKNLPKLGSALGRTVKNLREGMGGGKQELEEEVAEEEKPVRKKKKKASGSEAAETDGDSTSEE